jgi:hypothetical protein
VAWDAAEGGPGPALGGRIVGRSGSARRMALDSKCRIVLGPGPGPGPVGSGAASPQRGFFELTRQYGKRRLRKCD